MSRTKRRVLLAIAALVGVFALLGALGVGDVIDLPGWADIKGVDVPLIGDTDQIDCRLKQVDDTTNVQISIVDGDESTYDSYVHVWNNGNLVESDLVERIADDELIVPSTDGVAEQFYSISIEPVREGRIFCESITLD